MGDYNYESNDDVPEDEFDLAEEIAGVMSDEGLLDAFNEDYMDGMVDDVAEWFAEFEDE